MKQMTIREKVILSIILMTGLSYALFTYYIKPNLEKYTTIQTTIANIKAETQNKEMEFQRVEQLRDQSDKQNLRIKAYRKNKNKFVLNAHNLLAYIGPISEGNKVSITLFKELEEEDNKEYKKNPYHFVLQGDYTNLLKVMDSIGKLDYNYTISEYNMKVIDVDSKTNKPKEKTSSKTEYKWTSGTNTYVTGEFPLFSVEKLEDVQVEDGGSEEKKDILQSIKKVQIEFKLNFVVFNDEEAKPKEQISIEGNGKNEPFYSDITKPQTVESDEIGEDYVGEDLTAITDSKRALFLTDKKKLQKEIDKTLLAIYNREQKKMDTEAQLDYLKELLAITEGETPSTNNEDNKNQVTVDNP